MKLKPLDPFIKTLQGRLKEGFESSFKGRVFICFVGEYHGQYTIWFEDNQIKFEKGRVGDIEVSIEMSGRDYFLFEQGKLDVETSILDGRIKSTNVLQLIELAHCFRPLSADEVSDLIKQCDQMV